MDFSKKVNIMGMVKNILIKNYIMKDSSLMEIMKEKELYMMKKEKDMKEIL